MEKISTTLLLAVAAATVFAAVSHFAGSPPEDPAAVIHSAKIQAHELAVSGIDYALIKLREDPAWGADETATQITIPGVRIEAAMTSAERDDLPGERTGNARFITSSGSVEDASTSVQAIIECPTVPELPTALRYALFAGGDLEVEHQLLVRDESNTLHNANVHANRQMTIGSRSLVQGFGTYSGVLRMLRGASEKSFSPSYADGGKGLYRHPALNVPEIDLLSWENIATRTYASSTILAGDLDIGTFHDPGVWLIKGHLDLRDGIKGSGIVLVTGDLRLYGKKARSLLADGLENLLIIVGGNVFAEDAKIGGSIVCGGSFYGSGHVIVIGSLLAHGSIHSEGTLDVYFRSLPDRLASRVWTPAVQPPRIVRFFDKAREERSPVLAEASGAH